MHQNPRNRVSGVLGLCNRRRANYTIHMEQPTPEQHPLPADFAAGMIRLFEEQIATWQGLLNGMDPGVQKQALHGLIQYQKELTQAMIDMSPADWQRHGPTLTDLNRIVSDLVTDTQREYNDFLEVHETHGPELRAYYQGLINRAQAAINEIQNSLES